MNTPVNPSFTIKKWGVRGSTLYRLLSMMTSSPGSVPTSGSVTSPKWQPQSLGLDDEAPLCDAKQ